jgi:hypothetical protein
MNWIRSRAMRLAFGAAMLATTGFGVRTAVAAPASPADTARACPSGYNECVCEGFVWCKRTACPICQ